MAQDRVLQLSQRRAGLDPKLVDERGSGPAVRLERLGLPTRPVERPHHQLTRALPQRVRTDQLLGVRKRVGVTAARELGLDRAFARKHAHLLEPCALALEERLIGEIRQGGSAPQRERLAQQCRRPHRSACR